MDVSQADHHHKDKSTGNDNGTPLDQHLQNLDRVLLEFSEQAPVYRPSQQTIWKDKNNHIEPSSLLPAIVEAYAPIGLTDEFRQLHGCLRTLLYERTNVAAVLQGGNGKTLCFQQSLRALSDEAAAGLSSNNNHHPKFRVIFLSGLVASSLHAVVQEILVQLSAASQNDGSDQNNKIHDWLRFKKTLSFVNNLQLLDQALQMAHLDEIPFLFVLDPLEAFLEPHKVHNDHHQQQQQLLLYYLLDRVATSGSLVSLVAMTSDLQTMERLEKRTRSRAEGTAKFILFGHCPSWEVQCQILLEKIQSYPVLSDAVRQILLEDPSTDSNNTVGESLLRQYRLGRNVRWFCRVLSMALTHYRQVCRCRGQIHKFAPSYLRDALLDMGVAVGSSNYHNPALADLSVPQVVWLLAAKRILTRDTQQQQRTTANNNNGTNAVVIQLTFQRVWNEVRNSPWRTTMTGPVLWRALEDLFEVGLVRPAADCAGDLARQYHLQMPQSDTDVAGQMPLHVLVDLHREIQPALEDGTIHCSTALREWGRKSN